MKKHFLVHININLITHQISRALWFHQDNMPTRYQIYREIDTERERETERQRDIYIYIYIIFFIQRDRIWGERER